MGLREHIEALDRRFPLRILLPLAVVVLLIWAFAELADEVVEGSTQALDVWLMRALRTRDLSDPIGPLWLEEIARDITALGGTAVLGFLVLLVSGYLLIARRVRTGLFVLGSTSLGYVAIFLAKLGFDRPRPDWVPHRQEVYTSSFPSGHAMGAALTLLTLAALLARAEPSRVTQGYLLMAALLISALVGVSRVYLGVHYPTDVVGGWGLGAAWAVLAWLVADALDRRGYLDRSRDPDEPAPG